VSVEGGDGYRLERLVIGRKEAGEQMPALLFLPDPLPDHAAGVVAVHPEGKAGWVTEDGPGEVIAGLLAQGLMVLAIDPFGTGELLALKRGLAVSPTPIHFYTYNKTDTAERVQDILNALAYMLTRTYTVHLLGTGRAGLWCLLARGVAQHVAHTVVDAAQFDCEDDVAWVEHLFVPQVRRAGDFRTVAALAAPARLFIHNAAASFPAAWFRHVYAVAGSPEAVQIQAEPADVKALLSRFEPSGTQICADGL